MFPTTDTTRAGRMMAAGRITVTFRSPTGTHVTVSAKARKKDGERWTGCPLAEAMVVFIEVPNQGGYGDKVGKVTRSRGFVADPRADEARAYCGRMLLRYVAGETLPAGLEAFEEERCGVCGRALTDPVSIERGIGPECYGNLTGSEHQTKVKTKAAGAEVAGTSAPATRSESLPTAGNSSEAAYIRTENLDAAMHRIEAEGDRAGTVRDETAKHEAREQMESGDFGHALRTRTKVGDGKDKQGVAYGVGDWRARQAHARERIQGETSADASKRRADEAFARSCNRDDLYEDGIPY